MSGSSKKIGMLLEAEFPPDIRVENEALALSMAQFEVHIFALTFEKRPVSEEWKPGVWVHRKPVSKKLFNKAHITILKWPFYRRMWQRFVLSQAVAPDAIHAHDLPLARAGYNLANRLKVPFVLDLHENYPAALGIWAHSQTRIGRLFLDLKSWRAYESEMVQKADNVIVVVDEALERFKRENLPLEKFRVISNVLNLETFPAEPGDTEGPSKNGFIISYVGGFGVHRGLETVVQAMPQILQKIPTAKLVLTGDGRNFSDLKNLSVELGVENSVTFTGWLRFKESTQVIQNSDVCVIPHLSTEHTNTTVPHKLFQYMYLKKPVLVSSSPPLKRIVQETGSGLVFEAGNSADFRDKLVQMFESGNLEKWGANGHKAVLEKYNWKKESEKLIHIYRVLLNG